MKKRKFIDLTDNLTITKENVQTIGEKIAVSAIKHAKRFAYGDLDRLYRELVYTINNTISIKSRYLDGYDIAQEAICYLCNFIGHKLGEICVPNIHKGFDCIKLSCFKHIYQYLRKERKFINQIDIDSLKKMIKDEFEDDLNDYSKFDEIISKLDLNKDDELLLEYLSNNMSRPQIAEILKIDVHTVTDRKKRIRQKYMSCFS